MKLYLKKRLVIGFCLALLVLSALGIYAYLSTQRLIDTMRIFYDASRIVTNTERLLVAAIDLETGVRGYVITGDESYLAPYDTAKQKIPGQIEQLIQNTSGNPVQNARIKQLRQLINERRDLAAAVIQARDVDFEKARAMVSSHEGKRKMDEIRTVIAAVQAQERDAFHRQNRITDRSVLQFQYAFLGLLMVPTILIAILFYGINRHLNARTIVENDLRKASEEITELNRELESYTYSVSHDLRAPLRSISGYSQVLREDYGHRLDEEGNRVVSVVIRNSTRMGQLIDDLLHFSRVSRKELVRTYCNVEEIVRATVDELVAQEGSRKIDVQISALEPVYADASMLKQVWVNLISNALKYTGKKAATRISIGSRSDRGENTYYISDNGVGFSMAYKDKLFGVFQRLHKTSEFEGTGVGLALVKRIVNRHGGTIWAEAELDEGATFYFSMPRET